VATGTITITADVSSVGGGTIGNAGLLTESGTTGTTTLDAALVNTGTLNVQSGVISLAGGHTLTNGKLNIGITTVSFVRKKTGVPVLVHLGAEALNLFKDLSAEAMLFPYLASVRAGDRATEFKQRCQQLGIQGATLHSYRYAWAERAKTVGYWTGPSMEQALEKIYGSDSDEASVPVAPAPLAAAGRPQEPPTPPESTGFGHPEPGKLAPPVATPPPPVPPRCDVWSRQAKYLRRIKS